MKKARLEFSVNGCRLILPDGNDVLHPYEVLTAALEAVEGAPAPQPGEMKKLRRVEEAARTAVHELRLLTPSFDALLDALAALDDEGRGRPGRDQ